MTANFEEMYISEVLPGLFIGSVCEGRSSEILAKHKITHIIALLDALPHDLELNIQYLWIQCPDTTEFNIMQFFDASCDFIQAVRRSGGRVMVHSLYGISRAPTIVAAYIMLILNLQWYEAVRVIQASRPQSKPNDGFQQQLEVFQYYYLVQKQEKLNKRGGLDRYTHQRDESSCFAALNACEMEILEPYGNIKFPAVHFPTYGPSWRRVWNTKCNLKFVDVEAVCTDPCKSSTASRKTPNAASAVNKATELQSAATNEVEAPPNSPVPVGNVSEEARDSSEVVPPQMAKLAEEILPKCKKEQRPAIPVPTYWTEFNYKAAGFSKSNYFFLSPMKAHGSTV